MTEREGRAPEEVRRKLTRVYLEATRRRRLGLFRILTKENEGEIERLLEEEPIFDQTFCQKDFRLLLNHF